MQTLDRLDFETEASKEIYQFVERHGTAARHRVREMASLSAEEFRDEFLVVDVKYRRSLLEPLAHVGWEVECLG